MKRKTRICAMLLSAVFVFTCIPLSAAAKSSPNYIKVGLKYGSTAVAESVLKSDSGFQVINITDDGPEDTLPLPAYSKVVASVEGGSVVLRDTDGTLLVSDMGSTGAVMPLDYEDGDGVIDIDGTKYRDGVWLTVQGGSKLNVINYITMDHYLYGVIHAEMSQSFPLEALKAQAVVARSYAGKNKHAHSDYGFDVCTTTHCQVYRGYSNEYPKTTQAVDETSGDMIYSEGKVVQAYYYKNSGGHTQNSEDVWSSAEPYLRGVEDKYSPDYPWTVKMSFDDIKKKLETAGYHPGDIQSVSITKLNDAGAVAELTIKGSSNPVVLKKESVRTVLGASDMKSTMFKLANGTEESGGSVTASGDLYASNGTQTKKTGSELYVLSSSGSQKKVTPGDVYISNGSNTSKPGSGSSSGGSSSGGSGATVSVVSESPVVFNGKGYGHGIGMPQDSAIKMAEQGFSYDEILKFYFTGVDIR